MKRDLIVLALCAALSFPLLSQPARAGENGEGALPAKNGKTDTEREIEYKLKTNRAFLKAANKVVEEGKNPESLSYLKMAESAAKSGMENYNKGQFQLALEDFSESTQFAIQAITLSNKQDASIREFFIKEELILQAKRDKERKEWLIKKGMAEVEIFIKTAERLLKETKHEKPAGMDEAQVLYESSKANLEKADYDAALSDISKAYKAATATVKGIKHSQGDVITFPKPIFNDEKEILQYELKKNNSYFFFASQVIKDENGDSASLLRAGRALKEDGEDYAQSGDNQKAIEKLRSSTELIIKAIRGSFREIEE